MNLNLTSTIQMPSHQLRRQVIGLCKKVGKPLLKLSTKDYVDNGLGHLVEQFDGQAGLVNIEVFNELQHTSQALSQANHRLLASSRRRCNLDGWYNSPTDAAET